MAAESACCLASVFGCQPALALLLDPAQPGAARRTRAGGGCVRVSTRYYICTSPHIRIKNPVRVAQGLKCPYLVTILV